jgi:hypothetical protein
MSVTATIGTIAIATARCAAADAREPASSPAPAGLRKLRTSVCGIGPVTAVDTRRL